MPLDGFNDGFQEKYKLDGKLFRRSGTKLPMSVNICDLRFADDAMASCHNDAALQAFINRFTHAAQSWGSMSAQKRQKLWFRYLHIYQQVLPTNSILKIHSLNQLHLLNTLVPLFHQMFL